MKIVPRFFCPTKNSQKYVRQKDFYLSFFEIFYCCIVTLPTRISSNLPHLTSMGYWRFYWNLLCKEMSGEGRYHRKSCISFKYTTCSQMISIIHIQFEKKHETPWWWSLEVKDSWNNRPNKEIWTIIQLESLRANFWLGSFLVKNEGQFFAPEKWFILDQKYSFLAQGAISHLEIKESIVFPTRFTSQKWTEVCWLKMGE